MARAHAEAEVRTLETPAELDLATVETINIDQSQGGDYPVGQDGQDVHPLLRVSFAVCFSLDTGVGLRSELGRLARGEYEYCWLYLYHDPSVSLLHMYLITRI